MVFIESDLEKMILDIIKFNIMKERGVTELLFFNEFHLNVYVYYVHLQPGCIHILIWNFFTLIPAVVGSVGTTL